MSVASAPPGQSEHLLPLTGGCPRSGRACRESILRVDALGGAKLGGIVCGEVDFIAVSVGTESDDPLGFEPGEFTNQVIYTFCTFIRS